VGRGDIYPDAKYTRKESKLGRKGLGVSFEQVESEVRVGLVGEAFGVRKTFLVKL
jgi:hypothetical protein